MHGDVLYMSPIRELEICVGRCAGQFSRVTWPLLSNIIYIYITFKYLEKRIGKCGSYPFSTVYYLTVCSLSLSPSVLHHRSGLRPPRGRPSLWWHALSLALSLISRSLSLSLYLSKLRPVRQQYPLTLSLSLSLSLCVSLSVSLSLQTPASQYITDKGSVLSLSLLNFLVQ
jgi:hypothetical protein